MPEPTLRELGNLVAGRHQPLRQLVLPRPTNAGLGLALGAAGAGPAWSAWADIGAQADIVQESLITAIVPDTNNVACVATIDIGLTLSLGINYNNAAGVIAAVPAGALQGAHRMEVRCQLIAIAAGQGYVIPLRFPVFVPPGVGIIARWQTTAGGETGNLSVLIVQNWR